MSRVLRFIVAAALAVAAEAAWADGDAARGEKKFEECHACHALERDKESVGPSLFGVFGRNAGEGAGFRYSPAMAGSGKVWNDPTLDAYLTAPARYVPGNRMAFVGLSNPADRQNVIAYIKSASK